MAQTARLSLDVGIHRRVRAVMSQAVIGAIVVKLELEAASVVLHLGTALAPVAALIRISFLAYGVGPSGRRVTFPSARGAIFAAVAVLTLLLVGSYVSGSEAGAVFNDWPLMDGKLVPDLASEKAAIHFLHRALAGVVGVIVSVVCIGAIRRRVNPHYKQGWPERLSACLRWRSSLERPTCGPISTAVSLPRTS